MIKEFLNFAGGYRILSIKNINGRQGLGWSGTVVKDGRIIAEAADYADGGAVRIDFYDRADEQPLNDYAKTKESDYSEASEFFLGNLVNYEIAIKSLVKKSSKMIIGIIDSKEEKDEYGVPVSCNTFKVPYTQENRAKVLQKYPEFQFFNDDIHLVDIKKPAKPKFK